MEHKRILGNTFFQTVAKITNSAITFAVTIMVAREFGVLGYGDFTKITVFVGLFYLVVDFGLNAVFLQKNISKQSYFRSLLYLRLFIAFFLLLFINGISFFLPYSQELNLGFSPFVRIGILIFSFSLFTQAVLFSATAIFQHKQSYDLFLKASLLGSVVTLILVFSSLFFSLSLYYILLSFVLGGASAALLAIVLTKEKIVPVTIDLGFTKSLLRDSIPLGLMLVFNLIYFRIDTFLLSFLRTTSEVGIYGISQRFFDFLIALPLFLSNSLYPILLHQQKNPRRVRRAVTIYLGISLAASVFLIVLFFFLSPLLSLIKHEFAPAVLPFRILLLSLPFFFLTSILQWALIAKRQQQFLMYVYFFSAILNIILNLVFIPSFSYIASAVITGVCEGIVFFALAFKFFGSKSFIRGQKLI